LTHTLSWTLSKGGAVSGFDCMSENIYGVTAEPQKFKSEGIQSEDWITNNSNKSLQSEVLMAVTMNITVLTYWCHVIFFFVLHTVAVNFQKCLWISNIHTASHPKRWYALRSSY